MSGALTEEFLAEVLSEVRRWRRASLSDLVPYNEYRAPRSIGQMNMCSPEVQAYKIRVWGALEELVRRGVLKRSSGYTTTQYWEAEPSRAAHG